ncbi:MAG: hypothetical protein K2R98_03190 [Gemmataceae bacterium]|nr:hypothetical protein [Gemmataceae bacterium]
MATPTLAPAQGKVEGGTSKEFEQLDKTLKELGKAIADDVNALRTDVKLLTQKTQGDIEALKKQVAELKSDVEAMKKTTPSTGSAGKEMEDLRQQISRLQQSVDALRSQMNSGTRVSAFPPSGATGRVRLVNETPEAVDVVLNGVVYSVAPFVTRELTVPAGTFAYRVVSRQGADQPRALNANETFTVTVHPR